VTTVLHPALIAGCVLEPLPGHRIFVPAPGMSSVSVLHILEQTIGTRPPPPGSVGLMIGVGPGVSAELVLLQW
jgi:alkylresorcinol/alkylpyrone synthase